MSWVVDERAVTHERLDDEVIAIALETGVYYSLRGVAADCWSSLDARPSTDDVATVVTTRYDVSDEVARADVDALLRALQAEGIVSDDPATAAGEEPAARTTTLPAAPATRLPYEAPSFERFDDMRELLLLDPIHEVDAAGWPVPLPETA